jgi:isochorismate hydrolase
MPVTASQLCLIEAGKRQPMLLRMHRTRCDAAEHRVLFVADATAALSDNLHNATLDNMCEIFADVVTAEEVVVALAGSHSGNG